MVQTTDSPTRYVVTGGAGFIGSHIVDRLLSTGSFVTVYDAFLGPLSATARDGDLNSTLTRVQGDLRDEASLRAILPGHDVVIHCAAYADPQHSRHMRNADLDHGIIATYRLLEVMADCGIRELIFTSSQLVYGDVAESTLSETFGPLLPTSLYGASKLACEGLVSAFSHMNGVRATICRLCNIVGGGMSRGIVYDFVKKLLVNPNHLVIRGDGRQARSYLWIEDLVDAIQILQSDRGRMTCDVYNVSNRDTLTAAQIGEIVIHEMGLSGVTEVSFTGGRKGSPDDVPSLRPDISKISALDWEPTRNSATAISDTTRRLINGA